MINFNSIQPKDNSVLEKFAFFKLPVPVANYPENFQQFQPLKLLASYVYFANHTHTHTHTHTQTNIPVHSAHI
jgi:hypothetical protein